MSDPFELEKGISTSQWRALRRTYRKDPSSRAGQYAEQKVRLRFAQDKEVGHKAINAGRKRKMANLVRVDDATRAKNRKGVF